jgi:predicted cupin superfamily sugar epimerase
VLGGFFFDAGRYYVGGFRTSCRQDTITAASRAASVGGRMAKFMELNLDNTNQVVTVNADKIVKFWRGDNLAYTVVELDGSSGIMSITVKETPNDIWNMAIS